jgi:hypothetical protein
MLKEVRGVWILDRFGIQGIVLYPFVLYASRSPEPRIRRHEMVHVQQIRRLGVGTFYLRYLLEYLQLRRKGISHHDAYRGISFEKEAYLLENDTGPLIS